MCTGIDARGQLPENRAADQQPGCPAVTFEDDHSAGPNQALRVDTREHACLLFGSLKKCLRSDRSRQDARRL